MFVDGTLSPTETDLNIVLVLTALYFIRVCYVSYVIYVAAKQSIPLLFSNEMPTNLMYLPGTSFGIKILNSVLCMSDVNLVRLTNTSAGIYYDNEDGSNLWITNTICDKPTRIYTKMKYLQYTMAIVLALLALTKTVSSTLYFELVSSITWGVIVLLTYDATLSLLYWLVLRLCQFIVSVKNDAISSFVSMLLSRWIDKIILYVLVANICQIALTNILVLVTQNH